MYINKNNHFKPTILLLVRYIQCFPLNGTFSMDISSMDLFIVVLLISWYILHFPGNNFKNKII